MYVFEVNFISIDVTIFPIHALHCLTPFSPNDSSDCFARLRGIIECHFSLGSIFSAIEFVAYKIIVQSVPLPVVSKTVRLCFDDKYREIEIHHH